MNDDDEPHNNFSPTREDGHKERLLVKVTTLDGLKALYEEWLPYKDRDDPYMVKLSGRIHKVESQLRNMRP